MDQHLDNSRNDFLWTLLANPANDAHLYAFNLQRLVNDFPQSGILQALLAHASDEKNLRQASVYFNPKSLYKLINAPSTFIGVPYDRIVIQPGIGSNGHQEYYTAAPLVDHVADEHAGEVYFNEHTPEFVADPYSQPANHGEEPGSETEHHFSIPEIVEQHAGPIIETAENIYVEEPAAGHEHLTPETLASGAEALVHEHHEHVETPAITHEPAEERIGEEAIANQVEQHWQHETPEPVAEYEEVAAIHEEVTAEQPQHHWQHETPEPVAEHHEVDAVPGETTAEQPQHHWHHETPEPVAEHGEVAAAPEETAVEQPQHHWHHETPEPVAEHHEIADPEEAITEQPHHHWQHETPEPVAEHHEVAAPEEVITEQPQHQWQHETQETVAEHHEVAAPEEAITEQPQHHWQHETAEPVAEHHEVAVAPEETTVEQPQHHWQHETPEPVAEHHEVAAPEEAITEQPQHHWQHETPEPVAEHQEIAAVPEEIAAEQPQHRWQHETLELVAEHHEVAAPEEAITEQPQHHWQHETPEPVAEHEGAIPEQLIDKPADLHPADEPAILHAAHETVAEHQQPVATVAENETPQTAHQTPVAEDIDETFDEIVGIEDINFTTSNHSPAAATNYFSFDREFGEHADEEVENEAPAQQVPVADAPKAAAGETDHQDVSKYHDEKMPYSFMWWLDKTRKEHAQIYQPYVKSATPAPAKKTRKVTDELQQQYFENIFHITSVEELDKTPAPPQAPYNIRHKEQGIIERFIKEEPQIRPQSSDKLDNENKAKKSSEDRDELVTETLAAIYSDQMLYHKAIASYKKLMLKFPEKSRYFADKIEQLEKKTN